MPKRKRKSVGEKARALKKRKGLRKTPHFKRAMPKGELIYFNKNAAPVLKMVAERGKRIPFRLKNVEWVRLRKRIASGGHGIVFAGRVKFKGKPSPQDAVVKVIPLSSRPTKTREIIKRLGKSDVPHPKMAVFWEGHTEYIVMEPFLRRTPVVFTKFSYPFVDFISSLDIGSERGRNNFRQAMRYVGKLSRAGLRLMPASDAFGKRADIFNVMKLKSGREKIFVQDIGTLLPYENAGKNWKKSAKHMVNTAAGMNSFRRAVAKEIVAEVAKEMGFSGK